MTNEASMTKITPQPDLTARSGRVANMSPIFSRLLFLAFITGFSGAMMPGPLLVAVIEQSAIQGIRAPIGLIMGHALLEFTLIILMALGLRTVLSRTRVRAVVGLVGGAALLYMSGDMLWHAWGLTLNLSARTSAAYSWPKLMLLGAVISLANPYFTGWWATIGLGQLATMAPRSPLEYISFFIGHEGADFTWYILIGAIVVTGRRWLTDDIYRALILVCGVVLFLIGGWFIVTGVRLLHTSGRDLKCDV